MLVSPSDNIYSMKTFLFWFFLIAIMSIHFVDMELTTHYIGNQWENETFPLMRHCIKVVGIFNAVWISRIFTYLFFLLCYFYRKKEGLIFIMFLITVIYYTSMVDWIFTLDLIDWPLP